MFSFVVDDVLGGEFVVDGNQLYISIIDVVGVVPEPASPALLGLGLLSLAVTRRRTERS